MNHPLKVGFLGFLTIFLGLIHLAPGFAKDLAVPAHTLLTSKVQIQVNTQSGYLNYSLEEASNFK